MREEIGDQDRAFKRAVIVSNALQAVEDLARKNPNADLSIAIEALERLAAADSAALERAKLPSRVTSDARRALDFVQRNFAESNLD